MELSLDWSNVKEILEQTFLGISLLQFSIAFILILAGAILNATIRGLFNRLAKVAKRSPTPYDDALIEAFGRPLAIAAMLGGIWGALTALSLPVEPVNLQRFVQASMKATFIILGLWALIRIIDRVSEILMEKALQSPTPLDEQIVPIARNTLRIFLTIGALIVILQELGYSASSLLAGLGLGGMAFALASKDTLANLFGSIVIFIDRPFHVRDWIQVGDIEGTVEEVGLRVTRIRTFANSLITLPNSQLTTQAVNNWSRMLKRRIKLTIGVTYDTTPDKLEKAVAAIKHVLQNDERIDQEFYMVNFHNFGAYSLDIFVYCFTSTTVWAEYLQVRQDVLLNIMREFKALDISFAFPTQTLHLKGGNPRLFEEQGEMPDAMQRETPE